MRFPLSFLLRHLAVQPELEPVETSCRRQLCGGQCLPVFAIPGCTLAPGDCAEQGVPRALCELWPAECRLEVQREGS